MTDDVILVTENGQTKLQAFSGTVGGNSVKAESAVLVDSNLAPVGTSGNPVRTDPTGGTAQPVSGSITANQGAPSGFNIPWNIIPADPSTGVQAKVTNSTPASGTAGVTVRVVQDTGFALAVGGSVQENSSLNSASNRVPSLVADAGSAAPAWTNNRQVPLSVDLSGNLRSRIESWIGSAAPTVGQKAMDSSLPVVMASDQSNLPIGNPSNLDVPLSTRLKPGDFPLPVNIADPTVPSQKLAVDVNGQVGINNFPSTQTVSGNSYDSQSNLKVISTPPVADYGAVPWGGNWGSSW